MPPVKYEKRFSWRRGQLSLFSFRPIDDVSQLPWVLKQIELQFALFVQGKPYRRIEHACVSILVLIVNLDFAGGHIVSLRTGILSVLVNSQYTVGHEADLASGGRGNHHRVCNREARVA